MDKKIQFLAAATRLMRARGLQALSFEAVAAEAGLSRQLVRYYYADLNALIVALCDHFGNGYREALVAGIVEIKQVERLSFFLDYFFGLSAEHPMPDNLEVYDSLLAFAVGSGALRDRLCDQYRTLGQVITHELAIVHPELDGHSCEELSFVFVSMMHAHWSFVASLGYSWEHGRLMRESMEWLIAWYVEDAPRQRSMIDPWARDRQGPA